jgi:hypothetical protein
MPGLSQGPGTLVRVSTMRKWLRKVGDAWLLTYRQTRREGRLDHVQYGVVPIAEASNVSVDDIPLETLPSRRLDERLATSAVFRPTIALRCLTSSSPRPAFALLGKNV